MTRRARVGLAAAVALTTGLLIASPASAATNVNIPADEGPHANAPMEWWYFTGHLSGKDLFGGKHDYGFELTFIRIDALNSAPSAAVYDAHFAITDLTRNQFKSNMINVGLQSDNLTAAGYDISVNGWHMKGKSGQNSLNATFGDLSYGIDLDVNQSTAAALHGDGGLINYTPFGTSYYYSETNLKASGTLWDHGIPVFVSGTAWQDHQWGNFQGTGGWSWLSLQLDNNTQYMIYMLKDANGNLVNQVGTKVNADGTTVNIAPSDIHVTPLGTWTSPTTGITYEQNWQVSVPGGNYTVTVQRANQELTVPIVNTGYWEGTSTVTGTTTGKAYAEVTPPSYTLPLV
jgi:predicted secreted hydrolase